MKVFDLNLAGSLTVNCVVEVAAADNLQISLSMNLI